MRERSPACKRTSPKSPPHPHDLQSYGLFTIFAERLSNIGVKTSRTEHPLASLLVRRRGLWFWTMAALALVFAVLIPLTRINADMTTNLPSSSPMRQGLSILEEAFPQMDIRMPVLRVMFTGEPPADSLQTALETMLPGARFVEVRQHEAHTLYQFMLPTDAPIGAVKKAIQARFGERIQVEVDDKSGIPGNLLLLLGAGVAVVFLILFLMCPSVVETLLFLLTIGMAVAINMGTNALLPSVRLVTHTLSAVLQLALSMDYAIILMNRYRQQKATGLENEPAMAAAISSAAPSILSSAFTTVAGLLMLVFMQLKIGEDLGVVLSKGVVCSLIATFTVLPALILYFDKAILATQKKVPTIPTGGLARFEMRFRVPLALVFFGLFAGSWFLQRKTEISYSVNWITPITEEFPERNALLLLYPTERETAVGALADALAQENPGLDFFSYPSIALKPRTVAELQAALPELAAQVPQEALEFAYYAAIHPEPTERLSLNQLQPAAEELLGFARQILPAEKVDSMASRFDMKALMRQFSAPQPATVQKTPIPVRRTPETDLRTPEPAREAPTEAPAPEPTPETAQEAPQDTLSTVQPPQEAFFSYEEILRQRSADDMAALLQFDQPRQISLVYRLSGRRSTMNLHEFLTAVHEKVLSSRVYASMIPTSQSTRLKETLRKVEAVLQEGPPKTETPIEALQDTLLLEIPAQADTSSIPVDAVPAEVVPAVEEAQLPPPTPLEALAELALSGRRLTAGQCFKALSRAGIPVRREEIDLLYLYQGYRTGRDSTSRVSLMELAASLERLAPEAGIRERLEAELGTLRGNDWSLAVLQSDLPLESAETFAFIDQLHTQMPGGSYLIGYSQMYKEIKDGFPRDYLFLTLLTILAIFLIVAWTFRSLAVPFLLIPSVLTGVWLNVYASGLGGGTMLFLAYLIVQGILMGAAIDYSILFTHYYRSARATQERPQALESAYRGSIHTILTSGLILVLAPWVMALVVEDPMILSILRSIAIGATATILVILFVLPGVLALMDRWIVKRK